MAEDYDGGWVKLWRKIKKSRVWLNDSDLKTWLWCLLEARHKPDTVFGIELKKGEFLTSYRRGADECKQPQTTFYRAMKRLRDYGMIKTRVEHQFTVVSICNFSSYQARNDEGGTKVEQRWNASGTEAERERNDNKKDKKGRGKEGKTHGARAYSPEFEEFWKAFPRGRRKSKQAAAKAFAKALDLTDAETLQRAAAEYAASDEGQGEFVKMPSTWLNQGCWEDDRAAWRRNGANGARGASGRQDRNRQAAMRALAEERGGIFG